MLITLLSAITLVAPQSTDVALHRTSVTSPFTLDAPIHITYQADGGSLDEEEELYAVATFETDGGPSIARALLGQQDGLLWSAEFSPPSDAYFVAVEIVSRSGWDRGAGASAMAVDAQARPLRGARLQQLILGMDEYRSRVAAELAAFPQSPSAYRGSWFCASRILGTEEYTGEVRAGLMELDGIDGVEAVAVRSFGHLLLNQEEEARALLLQAIEVDAASRFTARALKDYWYECYSRGMPQGQDEVRSAIARALERAPDSLLARQEIGGVSFHGAASLKVIEAVCRKWMEREPLHPQPRSVLARTLQRANTRLSEAQALALDCVGGCLRGEARLVGNPSNWMADDFGPMAYITAARAALQEGRGESGLAYALAAQALQVQTDATPFGLEAEAWEVLGQDDRAARAWRRALMLGSPEAGAALTRLGQAPTEQGADPGADEPSALAPQLEVTTIDGGSIRLGEPREEVLVLNFWGLGCAPCVKEMPELTELAGSFEEKDVLFVALTPDGLGEVQGFLATHPFGYKQVVDAGAAFTVFDIHSLPVHVVIDREGRIVSRLVGAGTAHTGALRRTIEALLASGQVDR